MGGFVGVGLSFVDAAIMLQEFMSGGRPKETLGAGTSVSFTCEDALALYREFRSRGIQPRNRPFVGNGLWVIPLSDPDGYLIDSQARSTRQRKANWKISRSVDRLTPTRCHAPNGSNHEYAKVAVPTSRA